MRGLWGSGDKRSSCWRRLWPGTFLGWSSTRRRSLETDRHTEEFTQACKCPRLASQVSSRIPLKTLRVACYHSPRLRPACTSQLSQRASLHCVDKRHIWTRREKHTHTHTGPVRSVGMRPRQRPRGWSLTTRRQVSGPGRCLTRSDTWQRLWAFRWRPWRAGRTPSPRRNGESGTSSRPTGRIWLVPSSASSRCQLAHRHRNRTPAVRRSIAGRRCCDGPSTRPVAGSPLNATARPRRNTQRPSDKEEMV